MKINEKLRELRENYGLTQAQVGRAIFNEGAELTSAAISQYELGKRNINLEVLEKYANVFGYTVDLVLIDKTKGNRNKNFYKKKSIDEIIALSPEERLEYIFVVLDDNCLAKICNLTETTLSKLSCSALKELLSVNLSEMTDKRLRFLLDENMNIENNVGYTRIVKLNHKDVIKDIENACLEQCGIHIRVEIETLAELDGELSIYIETKDDDKDFTYEEIISFIHNGWLTEGVLESYIKSYPNHYDIEEMKDSYYVFDDIAFENWNLSGKNIEEIIIEKTYGKGSKLIGAEGYYDDLTIIIAATEY